MRRRAGAWVVGAGLAGAAVGCGLLGDYSFGKYTRVDGGSSGTGGTSGSVGSTSASHGSHGSSGTGGGCSMPCKGGTCGPDGVCVGSYLWAVPFSSGGKGWSTAEAVAVAQDGSIVVAGNYGGDLYLGNLMIPGSVGSNGQNAFVARLDKKGVPAWMVRLGTDADAGPSDTVAASVAVDGTNQRVVVGGAFGGATRFVGSGAGCGEVTAIGAGDSYVVSLDLASGSCVWAKHFGHAPAGPSGTAQPTAYVAVDTDGAIAAGGTVFEGPMGIDFGGGQPMQAPQPGLGDVFMGGYMASGAWRWSEVLGDPNVQQVWAVAVDPTSHASAVTGQFSGSFSLSAAPGDTTHTVSDVGSGADVFVATYDTSGKCRWAMEYGGDGPSLGQAIGFDPSGDLFVGGTFQNSMIGSLSFEGVALTSKGSDDVFVAALKPAMGGGFVPDWAHAFGSAESDVLGGLAVDPTKGGAVVVGLYRGNMDFGATTLPFLGSSAMYPDIFVARLDAKGKPVWARGFGNPNALQTAGGVAIDESSNVVVVGSIFANLDVVPNDDTTRLQWSATTNDPTAFVLKLTP